MVESEGNFTQIKREELFGYATVLVEPIFRITPEPFNTVNRVSPFRYSFLFGDNSVFSFEFERSVGMVVVGEVQRSRCRSLLCLSVNSRMLSVRYDRTTNDTVSLENAEDKNLPRGAPSPFFLATKG